MRRKTIFKRGRMVAVLAAGGFGYAIGGWHAPGLTGMELSAAQSVALRFPEDWNDATPATQIAAQPADADASAAGTIDNAQFALLSPEPMMAQSAARAGQPPQQAALQMAALEEVKPAPATARPQPAAAAAPMRSSKPRAAAAHHNVNRSGYLLDDAQIASIKQRLHLTPDQEAMWPAVEAALRNIAYAKAQESRRHGGSGATLATSIDPNSAEVQGLKSAAVPLIMSFNYEQKEEVRNLAHVMGLDQLASQF